MNRPTTIDVMSGAQNRGCSLLAQVQVCLIGSPVCEGAMTEVTPSKLAPVNPPIQPVRHQIRHFRRIFVCSGNRITNTGRTALELIPVIERKVSKNRDSASSAYRLFLKCAPEVMYGIPRRFPFSACPPHAA